MPTVHQTLPPIQVPFDGSSEELETAAQQIEALVDSPGYDQLLRAIGGYSAMIENRVASTPPIDNVAFYADAAGERRGLASVDRIARGVIANATLAAEQARAGGST